MGQESDIIVTPRSPRRVGIVKSDLRDKTRKVSIHRLVRHAKYGKYVRRRTVLQVHDEHNVSKIGDRVEVAECRPISKTKSWVLVSVLETAAAVPEASPPGPELEPEAEAAPAADAGEGHPR